MPTSPGAPNLCLQRACQLTSARWRGQCNRRGPRFCAVESRQLNPNTPWDRNIDRSGQKWLVRGQCTGIIFHNDGMSIDEQDQDHFFDLPIKRPAMFLRSCWDGPCGRREARRPMCVRRQEAVSLVGRMPELLPEKAGS